MTKTICVTREKQIKSEVTKIIVYTCHFVSPVYGQNTIFVSPLKFPGGE